MATIVKGDERIEVPGNDLRIQAYNALQKAAERIGRGNYEAGLYKPPTKRGRKQANMGYSITEAHEDVIKAMHLVLVGTMSPDSAMNLLRRGDVLDQRLKG